MAIGDPKIVSWEHNEEPWLKAIEKEKEKAIDHDGISFEKEKAVDGLKRNKH